MTTDKCHTVMGARAHDRPLLASPHASRAAESSGFRSGAVIAQALRALLGLMMFLTLLAMGMGLTFAEVVGALRRGRILALGIVVNFVAIPALVLLLVKIFAIDDDVAVGLLLCGITPGSGVGPLLVDYARGDVGLSVGLLLGLTFSSVVLTPILLGWWSGGDFGPALSATTWPTMRLILAFQVVPLIAGLLLRRYAESRTRRAQPWIARIARWLMLGIIAAYLITQGQLLLANGLRPFVVSVVAILASFLVGWAPPLRARTERVALGITSMNRNLALAMLLAAMLFPHPATLATVLAYGILMLIVAFVIAAWFRRSAPGVDLAGGAGDEGREP